MFLWCVSVHKVIAELLAQVLQCRREVRVGAGPPCGNVGADDHVESRGDDSHHVDKDMPLHRA